MEYKKVQQTEETKKHVGTIRGLEIPKDFVCLVEQCGSCWNTLSLCPHSNGLGTLKPEASSNKWNTLVIVMFASLKQWSYLFSLELCNYSSTESTNYKSTGNPGIL